MKQLSMALLLAAGTILTGCKSNEPKPEETAPPPQAAAAPAPAPVAAKPECAPEPVTKKKTTKKTTKKTKKTATQAEAPAVDCEPAKPKTAPPAKAAEPVAAPAPTPAKEATKPAEAGKPRIMKSRDGTFDGEVYGNIPAGSKWSKLQIGMHQSEVERILGTTSNIRGYVTAKAWIPFYFGNDSHRYEAVYAGQGSVAYTGGGMGGGQGTLMMINYDPTIQ